jgi:hypothetical protein
MRFQVAFVKSESRSLPCAEKKERARGRIKPRNRKIDRDGKNREAARPSHLQKQLRPQKRKVGNRLFYYIDFTALYNLYIIYLQVTIV